MKEGNPESWKRLEAILEEALELAPEARATFLERMCAGDSELRQEVEILLTADAEAEAGQFMQEPALEFATTLVREEDDRPNVLEVSSFEGDRIGPYQIVRQIGSGGMGAVFLAKRADGQFDQHVALKIIKRGLDTEEVLKRFLQERQILARFEHPNIARLLDGGVTKEGVPYFAMEYVEGTQITNYSDERRFSINERLGLFLAVCGAVHHAHRNLIVHRDLKPSNILVTREGEIKLLDFGIAKLLGEEATRESATLTRAGERVMTPAYAAPEQVLGEPVTTATDVYALGVTLYELLTGHRPLHFDANTPGAIEQAILHASPQLPSMAIQQVEEIRADGKTQRITPQSVSQARNTQAERLRRRLAGDLDNIVLMALRKEPERRYSSAEALSDDIRRYLAGWPVAARKDTVGYRLRKFVLRNRVAVATASLVILSLLLGLGGTAWQARVASQEARKAAEVKDFLVSLFAVVDPDESKGETISARELLDRGADRIERELSNQPEVKEEMIDLLANVYQKLGVYERAQLLAEQTLAMRRNLYGEENPRVAESLDDVAQALYHRGDYDAAEKLFRESLGMRRRILGEETPEVADSLNHLALLLEEKGDYDAAEQLLRESLEMRRRILGEETPEVADSLSNLASLLSEKGDYTAAEPLFREALAKRRRLLGNEHYEVATDLNNLADLLRNKGDSEGAEVLVRQALEIYRNWLGEEHPYLTIALHNLASLLHGKGDYQQAEKLYREVLAKYRLQDEKHPNTAAVLHNLASLLLDQGDYDEAVALYRQALDLSQELLGEEHPLVAAVHNRLGIALLEKGDPQEGQLHLEKALGAYRTLYPEGDRRTVRILAELGRALLEQGRPSQAEPLLRQALSTHLEKFGEADQRTAEVKMYLGLCLKSRGQWADAERLLREAHTLLTDQLGEEHLMALRAQKALFELHNSQER